MKLTGLIFGKAHDLGQRFTWAPRARVALVTGLAAAALLGGAAVTAQASTTPSAAPHATTGKASTTVKLGSAATPATVTCSPDVPFIDEHHGSPVYSYVPGNGNVNLYFYSSAASTYFCGAKLTAGKTVLGYQIFAKGTNVCLAVDASTASIHEGSATACGGLASYTIWNRIPTSNPSYYLYQSQYNNECIYEDTQSLATYSGCIPSDQFEWLNYP